MPSISDATTMCRAGQTQQAYELAKRDLEQKHPWAQREMGWVLYYLIKIDAETGNFLSLISHLEELNSLDQLVIPFDSMIYENVLFKVAEFVKDHVPEADIDSPRKLSLLFNQLRSYNFEPSRGYSFLLQSFIKCDRWPELIGFLDWWNLEKLAENDYVPYKPEGGKTILSVAERAFIAKSKALLRLNDRDRINEFLPKLDRLMNEHPEMTYPGYFYGKLLLALGSSQDEALDVLIPFARKKRKEFWVWQLLSEVFSNDKEKQLACLLRAVHCPTQENFLGKVRMRLARLCIEQNMLGLAKYQIERVAQSYHSQGYRIPYEVDCWMHQPWMNMVESREDSPINFDAITEGILCHGTDVSISIVTNIDEKSQRTALVYGYKKRMMCQLSFSVKTGDVLILNTISGKDSNEIVVHAEKSILVSDTEYIKEMEGKVVKRTDKDFAFLKSKGGNYFIPASVVNMYKLQNGEHVKGLIVYDHNRKKEEWTWLCISILK